MEAPLHINLLKLRAVRIACIHFLPLIRGTHTKLIADNIACMYYINCQGGTLCAEMVKLWNWCICHNVLISASYLTGEQNTAADTLSGKVGNEPNSTPQHILSIGDTDDRLVCCISEQEVPMLLLQGHLGQHWLGGILLLPSVKRLLCAFFPFPLLLKVLLKIKREKVNVILIDPTWPR